MSTAFEKMQKRSEASRPSFEIMVDEDIAKCQSFIEGDFDETIGKELHSEMAAKYNNRLTNFGNDLYGYLYDYHSFNMEWIGGESLKHNLKLIMYKLIAFKNDGYKNPTSPKVGGISITNNTENALTATQYITITFEAVKSQIEEMTGLSDAETKEALDKIDEINEIVHSPDSKKSKWQKVKPILAWIGDKSVDVGIALLPLILKIGVGS